MRRVRSVLVIAAASWGLFLTASPAAACTLDGWPGATAAREATLIVQATVRSVSAAGGWTLEVERRLKGRPADPLIVGTAPQPATGGECGGRIALEIDDHILIAFADPETALAAQTAVWWIESDGRIERTSGTDSGPTTLARVLAALTAAMPDTATIRDTGSESPAALPLWIAALVGALTTVVLTRRLSDRGRALRPSVAGSGSSSSPGGSRRR